MRYPSREGKEATARAHGLAPMGALLSACGDKRQSTKRGCDGSPTLRMSLGLWALPLQWSMLPPKHPLLQSSSALSPHAVFSLPPSVCFLGWLSKLQIPAPRPCVHPQTPISGWGTLGGSRNHLCRPHSAWQPQSRCPALFQAPETPLLSQLIPLLVKGLLQM